jgi:hypothetical protein
MSQAAVSNLRTTILQAVTANMLSNYECMFRKAGITEADSAFNMCPKTDFLPPHQRSSTFSIGCRPPRPKMLETPRKFKNPPNQPYNKCNGSAFATALQGI